MSNGPCTADTVVSPMSHDSPPVRRLADWDHERLEAVAAEHGTPLYVVDLDRVAENYERSPRRFPTPTSSRREGPHRSGRPVETA